MKFLLLCLVLLATVAAAQSNNAPRAPAEELTAEQEAKAFQQFKEIAKACREAGGCLIVTQRAAKRDLNTAFNNGVKRGQQSCGKKDI